MFDTSPTLYAPIAGDNGPGLKALIEAGKRWIQITAPVCPIESRVVLTDGGVPAHYLRVEPAPGIAEVLIDASGIGRNPDVPTDPSYSAFEYPGLHVGASYLAQASQVGDRTVTVADGSLYPVGSWVFLSDASTNPGTYLQPLDGPMESRRVVSKAGNVLTFDRAMKRAHAANVIAAIHQPIEYVSFRGLRFTGNAAGGIHLHSAHFADISNIGSAGWRGRFLVLLDNGGWQNVSTDVFCTGSAPGDGPVQNAWGFAQEGQEESRDYRCGGSLCGNGHFKNYCTDTLSYDPVAYSCNVNVGVYWQSLRSHTMRPQTTLAAVFETLVTDDSPTSQIIGRVEYSVPVPAGSEYLDPRELPVEGLAATDRVLAFDENGAGKQVPRNTLVTLDPDGSFAGEAFEVKSPGAGGGSLRVTNGSHSWLAGMLSADGSKDYVLLDLVAGIVRLTISATSGEIDVPGSLVVHGNLAMEAGSGVFMGGVKVLGSQRPAMADLAGTATLADVIAAVNADRAMYRAHGLIAG